MSDQNVELKIYSKTLKLILKFDNEYIYHKIIFKLVTTQYCISITYKIIYTIYYIVYINNEIN